MGEDYTKDLGIVVVTIVDDNPFYMWKCDDTLTALAKGDGQPVYKGDVVRPAKGHVTLSKR